MCPPSVGAGGIGGGGGGEMGAVAQAPATPEEEAKVFRLRAAVLRSVDIKMDHGDDPDIADVLGAPSEGCDTYVRFLRARNGRVAEAAKMLLAHLRWRATYKPWRITPRDVEGQAVTGKVRSVGTDAHGRPLLVLDNTRENSRDAEAQLAHLVFHMHRVERAFLRGARCGRGLNGWGATPGKFLLFIHLDNFSLRTMPARRQTMHTVNLVQDHFPERLGRAVLFCPPSVFAALMNLVKPLMSKSTRDKIVIVSGPCARGSANDATLTRLIGARWRELTGATMTQETPQSSPGYCHAAEWEIIEREEREREEERRAGDVGRLRDGGEAAETRHSETWDATGNHHRDEKEKEGLQRRCSLDGGVDMFYDAIEE